MADLMNMHFAKAALQPYYLVDSSQIGWARAGQQDGDHHQIEQLAQKIDPDLDTVCGALNAIEDDASKEPIARSFCLITAADGQIVPAEEEVLKRLLTALGQDALIEELPALSKRFQREDAAIDQSLFVIGDAANSAGTMLSNAANTAGVALGDVANTAGVKAGEALK
jgi:hypothetical protein